MTAKRKDESGLDEIKVIEAALFSAGHPLGLEELRETTEFSDKVIRDSIKQLIKVYKDRDSVLEVAQVGSKYAMQLRPEYAGYVQKIAPMEIPIKVLKTAALIAYHQPVRQRDLLDMVGHKVYDHVKILHELGLIRRRDSGRTKIVTTTERFSEYFGIDSTERDDIKKWMIEKLHLHVPEPKKQPEAKEEESKDEPDTAVTAEEGGDDAPSSGEDDPGENTQDNNEVPLNDEDTGTASQPS